jgi:hypothetical protein
VPGVAHKNIAVAELAGNSEGGISARKLLLDVADDRGPVHLGEALHHTGDSDCTHRPVIGEVNPDGGIGPAPGERGPLRDDAPLVLVLVLGEEVIQNSNISDCGMAIVNLRGQTREAILDLGDGAEVISLVGRLHLCISEELLVLVVSVLSLKLSATFHIIDWWVLQVRPLPGLTILLCLATLLPLLGGPLIGNLLLIPALS